MVHMESNWDPENKEVPVGSKFFYDDDGESLNDVFIEEEDEVGQERFQLDETELEETVKEKPVLPKSANYERFFQELFLEIYDIERGFSEATESYTDILLKRGVEVNPQGLYKQVELVLNRMVKLHIVKRLCPGLGLISEQDEIVQKELELIYGTPIIKQKSQLNQPNKTFGEAENKDE